MGWVDDLAGQIVGLDTAPLIYFIEEHPVYLPILERFFTAMDNKTIAVVTSTTTLLEVLIHPIRKNHSTLVQRYRDILLNATGLTLVNLEPAIAEKAAQLRATYNISTPDAIQIATAINMKASCFLTNDRGLQKVSDIDLLIVSDLT